MDKLTSERYQRQTVLPDFGEEKQAILSKSKVLIVGVGGLGTPVLQYLTGMGVGTIGVVDGDKVSLSNLQRQVIFKESDIGSSKVQAATNHLRHLNSLTQFVEFDEMLMKENAESIFLPFDLVVDCTDDIATRYLINDTCEKLKIPFVYGALYRHEGQVSVFNYKGGPTYRDAFPDDSVTVENCNEIGVLGALPGIVGTYQAMEAVKVLTGLGHCLSGRLLIIDVANTEHHIFSFDKRKEPLKKLGGDNSNLSWDDMKSIDSHNFHFIDIRDSIQFERHHDARFENIPLNMLAGFEPVKENVLIVCQQGKTSKQAAAILKSSFPSLKVFQVQGGYNAL